MTDAICRAQLRCQASSSNLFERRKAKSMAKARALLQPINSVMGSGGAADGAGMGSGAVAGGGPDGGGGGKNADILPMYIDPSITFEHVGGLDSHVRELKEMIVMPMLYPEVFEHLNISAPKGVLFHGPPGTGKTLMARAVANTCSRGGRRVSFFMRKGADCLSKWIGEAERQLRLLFDQAYRMRPR